MEKMEIVDIIKLLEEAVCEHHWNGDSLLVFIKNYKIPEVCKMLGYNYWDDGYGYEHTHLCPDGDISIDDFNEWLEEHEITPEKLFPRDPHDWT